MEYTVKDTTGLVSNQAKINVEYEYPPEAVDDPTSAPVPHIRLDLAPVSGTAQVKDGSGNWVDMQVGTEYEVNDVRFVPDKALPLMKDIVLGMLDGNDNKQHASLDQWGTWDSTTRTLVHTDSDTGIKTTAYFIDPKFGDPNNGYRDNAYVYHDDNPNLRDATGRGIADEKSGAGDSRGVASFNEDSNGNREQFVLEIDKTNAVPGKIINQVTVGVDGMGYNFQPDADGKHAEVYIAVVYTDNSTGSQSYYITNPASRDKYYRDFTFTAPQGKEIEKVIVEVHNHGRDGSVVIQNIALQQTEVDDEMILTTIQSDGTTEVSDTISLDVDSALDPKSLNDHIHVDNSITIANGTNVVEEGTSNSITIDVLANDSDPDGDPLTITQIAGTAVNDGDSVSITDGSGNTLGTATLNNGKIDFSPSSYYDSLEQGENEVVSFDYTISDGNGGTDDATVSVTVLGASDNPNPAGNENPEANFDSTSSKAGVDVTVDVVANDTDPQNDLDPTTVKLLDTNGNEVTSLNVSGEGSWSVDTANGEVTFSPNSGFRGDPSAVDYVVYDNAGHRSDPASIVINYVTGASTTSSPDASGSQGIVIDGIVAGLAYETSSGIRGYTEADGSFDYFQGDRVTFKIGNLLLGEIETETIKDGKVFLQDIAGTERADLDDGYVENMAVLLQSLDSDRNAENGIVITDAMRERFADDHVDLASIDEEALAALLKANGVDAVDESGAMEHVERMLIRYGDLDAEDFEQNRGEESQIYTVADREIDFFASARDLFESIGTIDLKEGDHALNDLSLRDVLDVTDNSHNLVIESDGDESVALAGGNWQHGAADGGSVEYTNSTDPSVLLKVEEDITVTGA